jgi:hypothetical protein
VGSIGKDFDSIDTWMLRENGGVCASCATTNLRKRKRR